MRHINKTYVLGKNSYFKVKHEPKQGYLLKKKIVFSGKTAKTRLNLPSIAPNKKVMTSLGKYSRGETLQK